MSKTKTTMFHLPIRTVSEANNTDHWLKKSKRHAEQKWVVKKIFRDLKLEFDLPIVVTLTRLSSKTLDAHDNLPASVKYIVDQIAAEITGDERAGRADDDKRIEWRYDQRKVARNSFGVDVRVEEI